MADDVSKVCSDYLRQSFPGLKASHARELVAAFFGYKSHAALLADRAYPVDDLDMAAILVPDEFMMSERRRCLDGLPDLPPSFKLVCELADFLQSEELFTGEVWYTWDIGEYVMQEYLPEHINEDLDVLLEDVIAETNAVFEDIDYDRSDFEEEKHGVSVTVLGTYSGYSLNDDISSGDTIDMKVEVYLRRCSGRVAFEEPEVDVSGEVNQDYLKEREPDDVSA